MNKEKGLKMYRDKFVVVRDSSESQEEKPIFILTEHDEKELLVRVLKNERALKLEKISSFLAWFVRGSAILALGVFLADFFDIFKASSETYLATLSVFAFLLFTNILLSVIYFRNSSFFFTKLFNQDDFFTVKEYAPEYFDNWMITVADFEKFKNKISRESKDKEELPAEDYIINVLILAYLRKKNGGREIPAKWADLTADKDEKYLEFTVEESSNF